ncbi:MAG: DUF58 domain-containing protein [Bacteroidales bacterium]|nr:DUF58 domain-containing protein [Bacteroidales bacterium]
MQSINELVSLQQFDHFELLAQQIVEGFITGMHRSPYHGFSVEFAEHRAYNTGESVKHIDWKLYGKTEKLYVKRYEEETNMRTQLVIDTSSSMLFPYINNSLQNKRSFAALSAAALIHLLIKQRDAVGLSLFNEKLELHTPSKLSRVHIQLLYKELNILLRTEKDAKALNKGNNLPLVLHQIADTIHKRSLVVIFTDMIDNSNPDTLFAALQHLKYNKHEVILFHVVDHAKELQLNFENRPTKFIDLETGEVLTLNPNEIKETYKVRSQQFVKELTYKCMQHQIDLVEADINKGFEQVLLSFLVKRNKLY